MDTTTLVVIGVIVLALIIAMVALGRRSTLAGRPALKPLTPEAHDRYVTRWDQVESHFVEAPQDAVAEADALVLALLGEREHPLAENMLPKGVRRARREASRGDTEAMRMAILRYRSVVEEMARMPVDREHIREGRRETA